MQSLLNPVIIILLLVTVVIFCSLLIFSLNHHKKLAFLVEKAFIAMFLITVSGAAIPPLNYLNINSLAIATTEITSLTAIIQLLYYPLIAFLFRSQFRYLFPSLVALLRVPFLSSLLLMTILSSFWSETPFVTFKASLILLGLSIYAAYIATRFSILEFNKILRLTGASLTVLGALVSVLLPSIATEVDKDGGWKGLLGHPNPFGAWMAFTTVLSLLNAINNPKSRYLSVFLSALSFFAMLRSHSGSSVLIFLVMLGGMLVFQFLRHLNFRQVVVVLISAVVSSVCLSVLISIVKQVVLKSLGKDATLTGRTEFWPQVIESIWKRPILGYGYKGFWQSWRGTDNPAAHIINPGGFVPPHSHNGYLEITLALGLIGIALFSLSLLNNIVRFLKRLPTYRSVESETILLLLIFILMPNLTEEGLWAIGHYTFLYVLISVKLAIGRSVENADTERRIAPLMLSKATS